MMNGGGVDRVKKQTHFFVKEAKLKKVFFKAVPSQLPYTHWPCLSVAMPCMHWKQEREKERKRRQKEKYERERERGR